MTRSYGRAGDASANIPTMADWKPIEIVAMVLGFILFWPIGLAILFAKIWQKKSAYAGDLPSFVSDKMQQKFREKWEQKMGRHGFGMRRQDFYNWSFGPCGDRRGMARGRWQWKPDSTGNLAFDEWREAELARLEAEREKLRAAEQEFTTFAENLRRAKDREEFERFMNQRNSQPPQSDTPPPPPAS
ncbi:MAG: DUF2852 domain-containing protein [Pseudomonadota bacterium]